ncbi:MAG: polysaccharide lyase 6 family protein [Spirochaetia bacterium]|nr:polysaccharide lyase 6 family protein [Spirochaetia bacterium]
MKHVFRLAAFFVFALFPTEPLMALTTEEFQSAVSKLKAGDTWNVPEGVHRDLVMKVGVSGAPGKPIRIRAATPGKTIFSGGSTVVLEGDHLVFEGFVFKDGGIPTADGHIITVKGSFCRVSDCAFLHYNHKGKQWVRILGVSNTYSRNWTEGKTTMDPVLQIEVDKERPNDHLIEGNYFGPRPELGENGGETMRIGYSSQSYFVSRTAVVSNVFEACDGEVEIISVKSCRNQIRDNTFLNCLGCLTLRHGNESLVEGNIFLAANKKDSGGIRVIGAGHVIRNNLIYQCQAKLGGAIALTCAQVDFKPSGYWDVSNVLIENNVIADTAGPAIHFSSMQNGKGGTQTILPRDLRFKNNLWVSGKAPLFAGMPGGDFAFEQNEAWGDASGLPAPSGVSIHPAVSAFDLEAYYKKIGRRPQAKKDVGPLWAR